MFVVVILGNRVNDDGTMSQIQKERLDFALEIEQKYNPDYYILSGGIANKKAGIAEAEIMYDYLKDKIAETKLIKEANSLTTVQNAKYSCPIIKQLKADTVMICTSNYHLSNYIYLTYSSFSKELRGTNITLLTYSKLNGKNVELEEPFNNK